MFLTAINTARKEFEGHLKGLKGVLHVGAHTGGELGWYNEKGFTRVVWFEPNKELFPILEANLAEYDNHIAYNIGIHDTLQTAILHIASNNGESSSILPLGTHKRRYPHVTYIKDQEIKLLRMDDFLQSNSIDINEFNFLNVDVQGVELQVIKSFGPLITKLDYIYTEVNNEELYVGINLLPEIDEYLDGFGFSRVGLYMTPAKWGDAFYVKKSLLS